MGQTTPTNIVSLLHAIHSARILEILGIQITFASSNRSPRSTFFWAPPPPKRIAGQLQPAAQSYYPKARGELYEFRIMARPSLLSLSLSSDAHLQKGATTSCNLCTKLPVLCCTCSFPSDRAHSSVLRSFSFAPQALSYCVVQLLQLTPSAPQKTGTRSCCLAVQTPCHGYGESGARKAKRSLGEGFNAFWDTGIYMDSIAIR